MWRFVSIGSVLVLVGCQSESDEADSVIHVDNAGIQLVVNEAEISRLPRRSVDSIPVLEITSDERTGVVLCQIVDITPLDGELVAVAANEMQMRNLVEVLEAASGER